MKGTITVDFYNRYLIYAPLASRPSRGTPRSSKLPRHLLARNNLMKAKATVWRKIDRAKQKPVVRMSEQVNDDVLDISAAASASTPTTYNSGIPLPTDLRELSAEPEQPVPRASPPLTPTLSISSSSASICSPVLPDTPSPRSFCLCPQILTDDGCDGLDGDVEAGRPMADPDKPRKFNGSLLFSSATTKAASILSPLSPTSGTFVSTMSNFFRPLSPRLEPAYLVDESFHCRDVGTNSFTSRKTPAFFVYRDEVAASPDFPRPPRPVQANILTPSNGKTQRDIGDICDHAAKETNGSPKRGQHLSHAAKRPPFESLAALPMPPSTIDNLATTYPGNHNGFMPPPSPSVITLSLPAPAIRPLKIVKKMKPLPPLPVFELPTDASYIPRSTSPSSSSDLPYSYVRANSPPQCPSPSFVSLRSSWDKTSFLERGEVDFGHGTVVVDQFDDAARTKSIWRKSSLTDDYFGIVYTACI
jgi:hypothetical protein